MSRLAHLIRIRFLYPNLLFSRGSTMHFLFMSCLFVLLLLAFVGASHIINSVLQLTALPFTDPLSISIGGIVIWLVVYGIYYGVTNA